MAAVVYHPIFANIPDEIIQEFLSHHLCVSRETFHCPTTESTHDPPFRKYFEGQASSADVLTVCKSWNRVGTLLLYETVVLRTKAQVLALKRTLETGALRHLRRYVRKFRVEDAVGPPLFGVLRMCTEVRDLWVNVRDGQLDGLENALVGLSPMRVTFWDCGLRVENPTKPKRSRGKMLDAVSDIVLPKWNKLETIQWAPPKAAAGSTLDLHASRLLTVGLAGACESLKGLCIPLTISEDAEYDAALFMALEKVKSLTELRILAGMYGDAPHQGLLDLLRRKHPGLASKIVVDEGRVTSVDGATVRGSDATNLPNKDYFAREIYNRFWLGYIPDHAALERSIAVAFHHLCLESDSDCANLAGALEFCTHGPYIRCLTVTEASIFRQTRFYKILGLTPNLTSLKLDYIANSPYDRWHRSHGMNPQQFIEMANLVGATLEDLDVEIVDFTDHKSWFTNYEFLQALAQLVKLKKLRWKCSDIPEGASKARPAIAYDALLALESLEYASTDGTLMSILCCLWLPSIREFTVTDRAHNKNYNRFLWLHGYKLTRLEVYSDCKVDHLLTMACPNLRTLSLIVHHEDPTQQVARRMFEEVVYNTTLEKIEARHHNRKQGREYHMAFLAEIDPTKFAALREIQLVQYSWPITESGLKRSYYHTLSEMFRVKGARIRVLDMEGKALKQRLKIVE